LNTASIGLRRRQILVNVYKLEKEIVKR